MQLPLVRQDVVTGALVLRQMGVGGFDRQSLDVPAPTIMADGIGGVCRRGWQYWVEGAVTLMEPNVVPKEGGDVAPGRPLPMARSAEGKPPYRVPLMSEVRALPWNGFKVASFFAGGGGSSTGYRMAGFKVVYANEFVEAARETYAANMAPGTILDGRDVREVTAEDLLEKLGMEPGELDVLDGSPPCASFSTAGKREKGWGKEKSYSDTKQVSDDLFFEFARIVRGVQPKVFVAENVSGLVKGTAKGYFIEILQALKACGYKVEARLLDAQWLGVPQARQRLIFVGVREDLNLLPVHPDPLPYRYSIRDALPWLTRVVHDTSGLYGAGDVTDRPSPAVTVGVNSINSLHFKVEGPEAEEILAVGANDGFGKETWQSPDLPAKMIGASPNTGNGRVGAGDVVIRKRQSEGYQRTDVVSLDGPAPTVAAGTKSSGPHQFYIEQTGRKIAHADQVEDNVGASLEGYAVGDEWDKLKPGEQSERFFSMVRTDPDQPCPTVTAQGAAAGGGAPGSVAAVTHPTEKRKFSIAELRRISGFPDDYVLTGSYASQWERLGRAVPPVMMFHVASVVNEHILSRITKP